MQDMHIESDYQKRKYLNSDSDSGIQDWIVISVVIYRLGNIK